MRKIVSMRLDETTLAAARERARQHNRTLTNYIESVLHHDLNGASAAAAKGTPPALAAVVRMLRARRAELESMGVLHASVFGSVARGDARPDSDVDIVVDVDPAVVSGLLAQGGIQQDIEAWIGHPVDLARRDRLRPGIAEAVAAEGIDAF